MEESFFYDMLNIENPQIVIVIKIVIEPIFSWFTIDKNVPLVAAVVGSIWIVLVTLN